jgi:sugar (pentulose or hexulose) kinase
MELLLGLDVGTSSVKCLAMNIKGEVLASAAQPLRLHTPQPGWVEQDPQEIWDGVVHTCRAVTASLPRPHRFVALSMSSQGGTTIPLDAKSSPTHPAFSWMDERASKEAFEAEMTFGKDWIVRTTGWALSEGLPLNHIVWFRKHHPEEFAQTKRFCFVNDFILSRLCGEYVMDPSDAGITQLFDLAAGEWDPRLLDYAGIQPSQLSTIRESGQVVGALTREGSEQIGLATGVQIVNGAHDQYCAALGTGTTQPGKALLSSGTAWVILAVFGSLEEALRSGMSVSRHAIPGLYGGILSMGGVGASVEWLLDLLWPVVGDRVSRHQALDQAVLGSAPGSGGLIFRPLSGSHLKNGETIPGSLTGLALRHTRGDIARALLEGVAMELRWLLEAMGEGGQVDRLKMIGGAARSPIWPQIIADIIRRPLEVLQLPEAASLGAAILAGRGAGLFNDDQATRLFNLQSRQVSPDPTLEELYARKCESYRHLWNSMPHHQKATNDRRLG